MYEFADFRDPIDAASETALWRLTALSRGIYDVVEEPDLVFEHYLSIEDTTMGPRHNTRLEIFASAFSDIHADMMLNPEPSEYFNDVIAGLVRTAIQYREGRAGNAPTQLVPEHSALTAHINSVWQDQLQSRQEKAEFSVFNFHFKGGIAQIKFVYDVARQSWNLGYGFSMDRVILHLGHFAYEEEDGIVQLDPPWASTDRPL